MFFRKGSKVTIRGDAYTVTALEESRFPISTVSNSIISLKKDATGERFNYFEPYARDLVVFGNSDAEEIYMSKLETHEKSISDYIRKMYGDDEPPRNIYMVLSQTNLKLAIWRYFGGNTSSTALDKAIREAASKCHNVDAEDFAYLVAIHMLP